jgi:nucleoside-diphosphate-sugar epimerase
MRHLVTGGSGFLGNLIAIHLIARGEEVRILDIWEDQTRPQKAEFVQASVLDREAVAQAMRGVDIVHHTAALVPLTKAGDMFRQVNVEGTRIVAEEAVKAEVKCFIHTSSSAIFGCAPCPITNATPTRPVEIYGKSKLDGELVAREIAEKAGMPLIAVRPRTIIADGRLGIFQILFDWIKNDVNVYVIGSGKTTIQFLHAQDLIDCYLMLVELNKPGLYNVGTDRYNPIGECLSNLIEHAGSKAKVKRLPHALTVGTLQALDAVKLSPLAPWHYLTYGEDFYFDVEPLKQLGWKPKYSNDEMLAASYDSFIANYDELMATRSVSAHRKPLKEQILKMLKVVSKFG